MLVLTLNTSPWLLPSLVALHGLAVMALWLAAQPAWVSAVGSLTVLASLHRYRPGGKLSPAGQSRQLRLHVGFAELVSDGESRKLEVPTLAYQSRWLTVLQFATPDSRGDIELLIWPDTLSGEQHRCLRRYLRDG